MDIPIILPTFALSIRKDKNNINNDLNYRILKKMIASYANVDSLYNDVLTTIAHLMRANNISMIDMRDTVFGKNGGWEKIFINKKGEIGYTYRLIKGGNIYGNVHAITFPYNAKRWCDYIHRLDLPNLLKVVVNKICDQIMVCDINDYEIKRSQLK